MTTYYKKLNLNINHLPIDIKKLKGELTFGYGDTLSYYHILDKEYLNSIFKNVFITPPRTIFFVESIIGVGPHQDAGIIGCLNYYITPNNFTTKFWLPKENARRRKGLRFNPITNKQEEVLLGYVKDDLILVDSFLAKDNEAYVFNNGEIHSVEAVNHIERTSSRTMVQFQWGNNVSVDKIMEAVRYTL